MTNTDGQQRIDYTSRDFGALRNDIVARARFALPEWADVGAADFTIVLLEQMAYVGDIISFYTDRVANEAFVQSAVLRSSLLNHAAVLDYRPTLRQAARAQVTFTKSEEQRTNTLVVPAGTVVRTAYNLEGDAPVSFTTDLDFQMDPEEMTQTVGVTEGTQVAETLGTANGSINQTFTLFNPAVVEASYTVVISEAGGTDTNWSWVTRITDAGPHDNVFTTFTDERDITWIIFGDGVFGRLPPIGSIIRARYRYGVGALGNVAVGTIVNLDTSANLMDSIASIANALPASGGADPESIESMRHNIPLAMRTLERAVTVEDYANLALRVPEVAKANANATTYIQVTVAIAPLGGGAPSQPLKDSVLAYLSVRSMIGTGIIVADPIYRSVAINASIQVLPQYLQATVRREVEDRLKEFLSFDRVSFAQRITIGEVYREILACEGVDWAVITVLNVDGAGVEDIVLGPYDLPQAGIITLTMAGGLT